MTSEEEKEHTRSHVTGLVQNVVSAVLIAVTVWTGQTIYHLSSLIAVNVAKTETIIQRIDKIEDRLLHESEARNRLELEFERRIKE